MAESWRSWKAPAYGIHTIVVPACPRQSSPKDDISSKLEIQRNQRLRKESKGYEQVWTPEQSLLKVTNSSPMP